MCTGGRVCVGEPAGGRYYLVEICYKIWCKMVYIRRIVARDYKCARGLYSVVVVVFRTTQNFVEKNEKKCLTRGKKRCILGVEKDERTRPTLCLAVNINRYYVL